MFERKISEKEAVRGGQGFALFISDVDMNISKIIKLLEDSCVLIDEVTKTVKHGIKNKKADFLVLCNHL